MRINLTPDEVQTMHRALLGRVVAMHKRRLSPTLTLVARNMANEEAEKAKVLITKIKGGKK